MTTAQVGGLAERWTAVLEHRDRAVRVARARLSDPFDVEDCVQEGMARVVAMPNLDLGRVGPLLSTVVANVAADTHRRHVSSRRLVAKVTWTQVPTPPGDEPVCDAAEARWLQAQLNSLGQRDRAVLELRAAGRTVEQTAAALGMTYKAVESAFTRARNSLKGIWRATLAAVALMLRRTWKSQQPAATASVLVAATLGMIALHVGHGVDRALPSPPGSSAQGLATPRGENAASTPVNVVRTLGQAAASRRSSPQGARDATRSTGVQPPDVVAVRSGRSWITREHRDESVVDTVMRCVRRGVNPDPFHLRCRD
jgi:RNA polymerase sigma-70 factor (ECF subfamily)